MAEYSGYVKLNGKNTYLTGKDYSDAIANGAEPTNTPEESGYVDNNGQKTYLVGSQYSDAIAAGATPVSDSSITDSNPSANRDEWVNDRLSGLVSPMSQEDISSRLTEQRKANALEAESIFTPKIESAKRLGAAQVSTAEGASGISQGFNLSTARLSLINNVQNQVQDRINDIVKQKESYIATGNIQAQQRADEAIAKLQEYNNNLIFKKVELALSYGQEQRAQDTSDFEIAGSLPSGTTWTSPTTGKVYSGLAKPEAMFKGSDIVELMKELPVGQTQEVTDPATGTVYTIEGIASKNANLKQFTATDDKGNLSIISLDPSTGEVVGQTKVSGVGKTKTQASNVTINAVGSRTPFYVNGKQSGYQTYNDKTGKVMVFDMNGNPLTKLPEGASLGTYSAGNPTDQTSDELFPELEEE